MADTIAERLADAVLVLGIFAAKGMVALIGIESLIAV